jgi:hypothetical protein
MATLPIFNYPFLVNSSYFQGTEPTNIHTLPVYIFMSTEICELYHSPGKNRAVYLNTYQTVQSPGHYAHLMWILVMTIVPQFNAVYAVSRYAILRIWE